MEHRQTQTLFRLSVQIPDRNLKRKVVDLLIHSPPHHLLLSMLLAVIPRTSGFPDTTGCTLTSPGLQVRKKPFPQQFPPMGLGKEMHPCPSNPDPRQGMSLSEKPTSRAGMEKREPNQRGGHERWMWKYKCVLIHMPLCV